MKTLQSTTAAILCVTLFSCGNNESNKQSGNDISIDAVINSKSNNPDAKGDNKCLLEYQGKYDALLSEADVLNATGFSKSAMKTKYNNRVKNPEYHEFVYEFKNRRKGKVLGFDREMELPDMVVVRSIAPMSLTTFSQRYKAVTDEQMQMTNDALKDVTEGNSGDADADKSLIQAEKQGVDKEQIRKTGGALTDAFKEVSKGYKSVEGVGDAACWNVVTNELYVLQNGVKFEIRTDISNDSEANKSVAIKLAEIVLNKCR